MKIDVKITEVLSRIVPVKASSVEEALDTVKDMYKNEEIVLDYSDFDGNVVVEEADSFDNRKDFLINEIIKYMIRNEEKHCEELDKPKEHIYNVLKELQNYLPENFND